MKKNLYIIFLFLILPQITDAYTFTRTLSEGDRGRDVIELQKILNSNSDTAVSKSNNRGSYGNETDYFGPLTKDAVIRFQNLYAENILYPNNLSKGTGFVGKSTIAFLNSIQTKEIASSTKVENNTNQTTQSDSQTKKEVPEFLVSRTSVKADTMLYVGSQNKLTDISFYLGSNEMWKRCQTEYTCKIHVDKDTKPGTYKLHTSNENWGDYSINILNSSESKPKVSLKSLKLHGENLIKGEDFSRNMKVYTMFGVFKTETKNNSFILEFPKDYVRAATTTTEGLFYLENENGLSSDIKKIQYEI